MGELFHYKSLQHFITEDDGWQMIEHVLCKTALHFGGKVEYHHKQTYDLRVISLEYLASFVERADILHKNIILSIQDVSPNILLELVLTQLMFFQGFPPFLVIKYSDLLHFQHWCGRSVLYDKDSIDSIYDYLENYMSPTILIN